MNFKKNYLYFITLISFNVFAGLTDVLDQKLLDEAPYLTIECATSRFTPTGKDRSSYGVPAGHSVAFYRGLCKKSKSEIRNGESPHQIDFCKNGSLIDGVGVSTDGAYYDLALSITSGFDAFMYGTTDEFLKRAPLTKDIFEQIIEERKNAGDYDDIGLITAHFSNEMKKDYLRLQGIRYGNYSENEKRIADDELLKLVGRWTFGTDNALNRARYAFCYVEKKTKAQMVQMVLKFNAINNSVWKEARQLEKEGTILPYAENNNSLFYTPVSQNCASMTKEIENSDNFDPRNFDLKKASVTNDILALLSDSFDIPGKSLLNRFNRVIKNLETDVAKLYSNEKFRRNLLVEGYLPFFNEEFFFMMDFHRTENELFEDVKYSFSKYPFMTVEVIPTILAKFVDEALFHKLKNIASNDELNLALTNIILSDERLSSALKSYEIDEIISYFYGVLKQSDSIDHFVTLIDKDARKLKRYATRPILSNNIRTNVIKKALEKTFDQYIINRMNKDFKFSLFVWKYRDLLIKNL